MTGQAARAEIGQPDFTSGQPGTASNLVGGATGVAYANGLLWVADSNVLALYPENNRILSFATNQIPLPHADLPISSETVYPATPPVCGLCYYSANNVIGQPDFVSHNAGRLQVAAPANGSTAEEGIMQDPTGVATYGTYLAVADTNTNRVLIWNTFPSTINAAPNVVLGQTNFTSAAAALTQTSLTLPEGVWIQNGVLFVADTFNDRILIWRHIPTQNGQPADLILGQANFTTDVKSKPESNNAVYPTTTASLLLSPTSVTSDGTHLYVADLGNNRVLIWNTAFVNGQLNLIMDQPADVVVGQPLMTTSVPNWSSQMCGTTTDNSAPCAPTLNNPRFALSDGTRLYIADSGNDRVLIFNSIPTGNGVSANEVLGQVDFLTDQVTSASITITSTSIDNTSAVDVIPSPTSLALEKTSEGTINLYVADPTNRRILIFTPGDTSLPDRSVVNWASEIIRQEGLVTFAVPSGGAITAGDTVTITIAGTAYTYTVAKSDTLDTIAIGITNAINNSNSGSGDPNATAIFAGLGTGTVYLASKGTNLAYDSITLAASVSNIADLAATASGAYLSAGNAGTGAAGMLVEINGTNLSDSSDSASLTGTLPTNLGGVQVFMDGLATPVLRVSPTQVIAEIPFSFVNGSDLNAATLGTSAFTDRNSTSIYLRTTHGDGSVTITNATPMYIAPANPGIFNAPAVAGQPRPWPVINAFHQPGNPTAVVSVDGTVTAGNTASVTIASTTYTYTVVASDTLLTIAQNLIKLINASDPNVVASLGNAFQRIVLTAKQPGKAGTGIAVSATSSASATVTMSAYTSGTCCNVVPGSSITPTNPAVPGELITVSATGLGQIEDVTGITSAVNTGEKWYGDPTSSAVSSVTATMNGETAEVISAGLLQGSYGMYGIQMVVPSDLPVNTDTQIYVAQNAFISNTATIPVGSAGVPSGAGLTTAALLVNPTTLVLNAGAASPTQSASITVSNPNSVLVIETGISITGPNAADFSYTTTCQGNISQSCTITVAFAPSTTGMETASLVISDNVDGSAQTVSLTGVSGAVYEIANAQSGRVLDVMGGSVSNGALVQQYDYLGGNNQKWSLVPISGGAYVIMNMNSGLVLDVVGASTTNGTMIQQYQYLGHPNQQWTLNAAGNGFYTITNLNSGLVLDDIGGAIQNGALVQQYQYVGDANQQWSLISTQTYAITNSLTGSVLDVTGASSADGTLIQEWRYLGGDNQKWQLIPIDSTYYKIGNLNSGKVLDVVDGDFANGTLIQQYEYLGGDNQKWALVPSNVDGYYSIVNKLTGRVLDIEGASAANGTAIQQYDFLGGANQLWQLVPTH